MMPMTASRPIQGAHSIAPLGRIGRATRMNPYVPNFSRMAARITDPTVGASVWASGNQVWNGNIGTLMAKPMKRPAKISVWVPTVNACSLGSAINAGMSKVLLPLKYNARKLRIISALPNSVYRKNLIDAYCRLGPPHTPIMKYIGSSTSSKKTKNRIRSSAEKVPFMPVSSTRIRIRKALGLWGSGKWSQL